MIRRSSFVTKGVRLFVLSVSVLLLSSCSDEDQTVEAGQLHNVIVSLTGINFFTEPDTRASDVSATDAGITRIALKVFDSKKVEQVTITQVASEVGEDFNNLSFQLPAGTYTFVAVAHDATGDDIGCATITSAEVATLPEKSIPTLYSIAKEVTITNANNQMVTIDMGKRINATFNLVSTDIVPADVVKMAITINPEGTLVSDNNLLKFNPSTGLAIGNPRYNIGLPVTVGNTIDVAGNILLPADSYYYPVNIRVINTSTEFIAEYERDLTDVHFQRSYITKAVGQYFRYVNAGALSFDITQGSLDYPY